MNKVLLIFIWVLTGLSAYWIGLRKGSSSSESVAEVIRSKQEAQTSRPDKPESPPVSFSKNRLPDSISEQGEVAQGFVPFSEEREESRLGGDLSGRIQSSNPVIRMQAFAELLANPSQESIEAALEAYEKLPEGPSRFSELRMIAFSWA